MSQLQPVLWIKGAFLQPQHLQLQDLYLDGQMKFLMDSLIGYPYGFQTLTVDSGRLAKGYFGLSAASGIFPDGLIFDLRSDLEPDPRQLLGAFSNQSSLTVCLAVPHYRPGARNVSPTPGAGATARFIAGCIERHDESVGLSDKPKPIQIVRSNLRYLLPHDDQTGHSVLPVARIVRRNDQLEVDRSFVPALLHVSANSYLVSILRDLTGILSAKSQEHSRQRRGKGQGVIEVSGPTETAAFWLHHTINQSLPAFRSMLNNPGLHPHEQFRQMLSLAGALTAFTLKVDPNDLPIYDHDELGNSFSKLDAILRDLLETAIPRYVVSLVLKKTDQAYVYSVFIPEKRYLLNSRVFLAVRSGHDPERPIPPESLRVASAGNMQEAINSQLSGVPLVAVGLLDVLPSPLQRQLGFQYFQVQTNGSYWEGVKSSQNFSVYVPAVIQEPLLELSLLLKEHV